MKKYQALFGRPVVVVEPRVEELHPPGYYKKMMAEMRAVSPKTAELSRHELLGVVKVFLKALKEG
jgi:hypothetical protein